jgi:hypothetical protein
MNVTKDIQRQPDEMSDGRWNNEQQEKWLTEKINTILPIWDEKNPLTVDPKSKVKLIPFAKLLQLLKLLTPRNAKTYVEKRR